MPKQITLNQITLCADGSIGLQWLKQFIDDDGVTVLFSEPHRSVVGFDGDVDTQVQAVSSHLQAMGYPAITFDQVDRIKAVDAAGRSDPVIEATRAAKISAKAA